MHEREEVRVEIREEKRKIECKKKKLKYDKSEEDGKKQRQLYS